MINKKEYMKEYNLKYSRSIKGVVKRLYSHMKERSIKNNWKFNLTEEKFKIWLAYNTRFFFLYKQWVASNYSKKLKPSIDRINDMGVYELKNMRVTTWFFNWNRGQLSEKNINTYKNNLTSFTKTHMRKVKIIETGEIFESLEACAKHINGLKSKICLVCQGKRKKHKDLTFTYVNDGGLA